ncbi:terminal uridylyltransferase Tailor-like isoform X1 [Rhopalosiphum padi]|uniref:terminal uridylyltransferase Tailor-like isoform X1 n=2 Tax=Rhopalosiphum padi TaxID=40932 RepID=UPI00298EB985|nr:terminal uridylyltransferase Tailor-like isoform X1 [Rhopalosiphum padi]
MDKFHGKDNTEHLELLCEKSKFCHQIECLISSIDRINNDPMVKERLDKLKNSIEKCVENSGRVYIFGSRLYGIANAGSDVDLYFDTGDYFSGKIADDYTRQLQLTDLFSKGANKEFIGVKIITETRIPIVRFKHDPTNFDCDLHFRSGLSVLNSELIKLYLSMDERVRWVVIAVKHWAVSYKLLSDDFSTYSLIWLVLFVMMQYKIVPPIIDLWRMHHKHVPNYIEGWDTRICFNNDQLKSKMFSKSNLSKWKLLRNVFKFYSDSIKLQNYVLCTVLGELLSKKTFHSTFITKVNAMGNYQCQIEKFEKSETLINTNFGSFNRIELQNPLKLCNNVIPWLSDKNMNLFIDLCTKSGNSM